ncbi:metalloprotease [Pyrococcus furiosus DSM 3638]|uniref:Metalloprotease n=3 Tax=Pyrococcus furiosus TaxID=2261 RepID=A0A5C0XTT8_PYRFU|nr:MULTISPECIES: metalloprotease [Pyrococcus]AAL80581.1 metalloprotease [Pyrococcus furiosus DSM 3638]AFN03251.1 metalloprotease [Pyrococcus furiosus COM1]MDK2869087.1 hypothetical protein [Pyrococcus sp.]QEK78170.1 metalloprotease [Pyrococcus furiosus DSM 3638]
MKRQEIEDLLISFIVLLLLFSDFNIRIMPFVVPALLTAFIFHELAHRQVARYYGYYALYKRWDTGIIIALLLGLFSKLLTGSTWVFAALGAVHIYAPYQFWRDKKSEGIIALSGPLSNIIVAIVSVILSNFTGGVLKLIFTYTAGVNSWLAFFNLLPFPSLDGFKVLLWNPGYWGISIGVAFMLYNLV